MPNHRDAPTTDLPRVPVPGRLSRAAVVQPTREAVRSCHRINFAAKLSSRRNERGVGCESLLELHAARLFDIAPGVIEFSEQPTPMTLKLKGRRIVYTPDFRVVWQDGSVWIVEVKPRAIADSEKWQVKFQAAARAAAMRGEYLVVITDEDLNPEVRRVVERVALERHQALIRGLGGVGSVDIPMSLDPRVAKLVDGILRGLLERSPTMQLCRQVPVIREFLQGLATEVI